MKLFLILVVIAVFSILYAKYKGLSARSKAFIIEPDTNIDTPMDFGYKTTWIAVKTNDKQGLAECLKLHHTQPANWSSGIGNTQHYGIYITPAIGNWTLIVGIALSEHYNSDGIKGLETLLNNLSQSYGDAQFYSTHRVVEYHHWMRSVNGQLQRAYAYSGESGNTLYCVGAPTAIETEYNLYNSLEEDTNPDAYWEDEYYDFPDEDMVMEIAASWSINPTQLSQRSDIGQALGLIGVLQ